MGKEIWRDVPGYEEMYAISTWGRVKSLARFRKGKAGKPVRVHEKFRKVFFENGYPVVGLMKNSIGKKFGVHRLIALAFIPNPENKPEVNHKNGKKWDFRIKNLEWATRKENAEHASKTGLLPGRTRKPGKKLNDEMVADIRMLLAAGMSRKEIAEFFEVSVFAITDIAIGRTWSPALLRYSYENPNRRD